MHSKMRQLTLLVSVIFIFFNTFVYAYDDNDWAKIKNENPEYIEYYEVTITFRIAIGGSLKALQKAWYFNHPGTFWPESTFCQSVAGGGTIPEIWIRAKIKGEDVYPHVSCFGHEILHILKKFGLDVINPDQKIEREQ